MRRTSYRTWLRLQRKAITSVASAIRTGRLSKPSGLCVDCKKQKARHYDHRDYRKPLEVEAVCVQCNNNRGAALPETPHIRFERKVKSRQANKPAVPKTPARPVIIAARLTRAQAAALRRLARAQVPRQTRSQFVAGLVQAELERQQDRANVVAFCEHELTRSTDIATELRTGRARGVISDG